MPACGYSDAERGVESILGNGGYWRIIEAKPLQPVIETFYSIPTDGANFRDLDLRVP